MPSTINKVGSNNQKINLTDRGYPSSREGVRNINLTQQGYPSSTDGMPNYNLTEQGYPSSTEGMETVNLTDQGYPSSTEGMPNYNLTDQGYPSSTEGMSNLNLTDQGYPSSTDGMSNLNLTDQGYPASTEGYTPANSSYDSVSDNMATVATQNDPLNVRVGGEGTEIIATAAKGSQVEIIEPDNGSGWTKVRLEDGTEGYVFSKYLNTNNASNSGGSYTVQSGDTLSKIAEEHGMTYQELAEYNYIDNPD